MLPLGLWIDAAVSAERVIPHQKALHGLERQQWAIVDVGITMVEPTKTSANNRTIANERNERMEPLAALGFLLLNSERLYTAQTERTKTRTKGWVRLRTER